MSILDLSKTLMYDFHYNYIKKKYGPKARLLMTDTDSLIYEIEIDDFFEDIKDKFYTSNFDKYSLPRLNKKVLGMVKDEAGGKIISEFVGLRAKLYSYKKELDEEKKCKGVVKDNISFNDYNNCLFSSKEQRRTMNVIRSWQHEIFTETVNKVAFSANDDKRIVLPERINTLPHTGIA